MFVTTLAVLHVIRPSRGKAVVQALFGEIRPAVWVSDMLGSQRGHGVAWQVCLAHLLRDAQFAIECGDTAFSAPFRRLLLRAIAVGRRREALKDATLHYPLKGSHGTTRVYMQPAADGTGLIAGGGMRAVFECAGVRNVLTKCLGSNNPHNMIKATLAGIRKLALPQDVAGRRGNLRTCRQR